jgi:1,4-dihydroxy-2-naphthoate octaprenyltransferase
MDASSLLDFARIKPLAAWSLSSAILGGSLAFFLSGGRIAEPWPMAAAMVCVVLMQYVSHPLNDITDRELDARAAIAATGRKKPLVNGSATVGEARMLSVAIMAVILLIMAGLVAFRPVLIIPASYGVFAVLGYSHSGLRLSYRPFTELYLAVPVNTIAVLAIAYIGAGTITTLSVLVALAFGFTASSLFVSMMSMDYATDREDRKETTVVRYPRSRWCAAFPAIGSIVFIVSMPFAAASLSIGALISMAALSVMTFTVLIIIGTRVDRLRFDHLDGLSEGFEARSNGLRLKQLYTSVLYAVGLSVIFLQQGV